MDNLRGLIYVSNALESFDADQLNELAEKAGENNEMLGVTGYLYYENKKFLQYIEGEPDALKELMNKIEDDPRHEIVSILRTDELEERKFPEWDMKWITKPMLINISMENILSGFILMLKMETVNPTPENEAKVWEMVDRISRFKFQLS